MALDQIPAWLDVTPGLFVNAMSAGARAGNEAASLADRRGTSERELSLKAQQIANQRQSQADELELGHEKLAGSLEESAADRAMKERLSSQQQQFSQKKFDTGTSLELAQLGIRHAALDLQSKKENLAELKSTRESELKAEVDKDAASYWSDKAAGMSIADLAQKHSTALKRKDIQADLSREGIMQRQKEIATARAKTPMETVELAPDTGTVISRKRTGPVGSPLLQDTGNNAPASPYKEGQKIRNKKDGKVYIVRDGVPVLLPNGGE